MLKGGASVQLRLSTATVMFADVVESMRLMQQDEFEAVTRLRALLVTAAAQLVPSEQGHVVQRMGDGLMLRFDDARAAVRCAAALHRLVSAESAGRTSADRIDLRVGIHSAEVLTDEQALYGHGVNLTARIAALARPGETILSSSARDQLASGVDGTFEDLGPCFVKHVVEPVRLYRVLPEGSPPTHTLIASRTSLAPSLAILPFEPYEGVSTDLGVGDVLADQLIASLSKSSCLTVISRLSCHALRGRSLATAEAGIKVGADYVVTGRYHVRSGRLQVQPELMSVAQGTVLWADSLCGSTADALVVDSDLVMGAARAIAFAVLRSEVEHSHGRSLPTLATHTLHLAATSTMHRFSPALFEHAGEMLEALHERAPRHAAPLAWRARWHMLRVVQHWSPTPARDNEQALAHASRALDLDPESSLALTMAGCARRSVERNFDGAQHYFDRALAANPNESLAWLFKGSLHGLQGESAQAVDATNRALAMSTLDPMRPYYESLSASAATGTCDYERAVALANRALAGNVMHGSTYRTLAISLAMLGRLDEARATVQRLLRVEPHSTVEDFLRRTGDRSPHTEMFARALREAGMPTMRPAANTAPSVPA